MASRRLSAGDRGVTTRGAAAAGRKPAARSIPSQHGRPSMQFGRIWVLRGPNVWARTPVIEAELELGPLVGESPATAPLAALAGLGLAPPATYADLLLQLTRFFQERVGDTGPVAQAHATR